MIEVPTWLVDHQPTPVAVLANRVRDNPEQWTAVGALGDVQRSGYRDDLADGLNRYADEGRFEVRLASTDAGDPYLKARYVAEGD